MAFYNEDPNYVAINIESILNQTYKDFDYLIISDNPANETLNSLAKEYASRDSRIIFHQNETNMGIPGAKNFGLRMCKTEYIAISDADDFSHPERLEKQIAYLDLHPEVVAIGSYARIMDKTGRIIGEMHTSDDDKQLKTMLPFDQPIYHPVMTYRRIVNGKPVMYDENMRISLDYELCVKLSDYKFYNLPEYLLDYRLSPNQTTQIYRDKYIYYDSPVRKKALNKMYYGVSKEEEDAFISLYYGVKMNRDEQKIAHRFIKNLYYNNINNEKVYIDKAVDFLVQTYVSSIKRQTSLIYAFKEFLQLKKEIDHNSYSGLVFIIKMAFHRIKHIIRVFSIRMNFS